MPVTFGELSTLTTPLSAARFWALLCGCITFSLAASTHEIDAGTLHLNTFRLFCMTTWCSFFILTFFIVAINFIQFHSLLPLSWKNLTATVAALGMLMTMAATFAFPWIFTENNPTPRHLTATVASFLTSLGYMAELHLIRRQDAQQQRGYMASVPGLLKVLQVFGSCVALVLLMAQSGMELWRVSVSAVIYSLCLAASLGTVLVMVGDCAGRCPVPFDRVLAGFSTLGVLLYMVVTVICITALFGQQSDSAVMALMCEAVVASVTLLAFTVDMAYSVKMLCDRH
ncbi:myeloid-associated differentiation marker homolog [Hoplias malabaricus]|uniref:myeloid-associated differentiation marker homolog n=1 Tax=Hoplias malabaricus TaxID=27720 RepID=UPI003462FA90